MVSLREVSRALAALALAGLAGCATGGGRQSAPEGRPHYKVGAPYEINGRRYVPREDPRYVEVGVASWYGDEFHGKPTANGEIFDKRRLTAAHTTLPLPSLVEVENLENGRKAIIRVNDRGPFAGNRIIDLSHAAAIALGFERAGLARVRVRYLGRAELMAKAPMAGERAAQRLVAAASTASVPQSTSSAPATRPSPRPAAPPAERPAAPATPAAPTTPTKSADDDGVARLIGAVEGQGASPEIAGEYWIAVADFDDLNEMQRAAVRIGAGPTARVMTGRDSSGGAVYSLEIGPFATLAAADARLAVLRDAGYPDAWIAAAPRGGRDGPAPTAPMPGSASGTSSGTGSGTK